MHGVFTGGSEPLPVQSCENTRQVQPIRHQMGRLGTSCKCNGCSKFRWKRQRVISACRWVDVRYMNILAVAKVVIFSILSYIFMSV